jgi:FdrA protein
MTVVRMAAHRDRYRDSLVLLSATAAMSAVAGVEWAAAVMAAPANAADLAEQGVPAAELDGLSANDLVLAVRAGDDGAAATALQTGSDTAFSAAAPSGTADGGTAGAVAARTVAQAAAAAPEANVAIISVPGPYAALEAHHALSAGMHVLLFSDNVPVEEEVELKRRASDLGLLVMGPGAGTAVLGGVGLGFANVVRRGPVGVVAAAGTGAQEVSALLDRWGVGVSQVIGVGGRDLSERVGGTMARLAVRTLAADPDTRAVLLVSKPPAAAVAAAVIAEAHGTPVVATLLGLPPDSTTVPTLEQGAMAAARAVGVEPPSPGRGLPDQVARALDRMHSPAPQDHRTLVRGYFSGGTLCYEAQHVLAHRLGAPIWSNEPLDKARQVPAPAGSHVLLDLGAEEYTQGRPHPMIDPTARRDLLAADLLGRGGDGRIPDADRVAVVLLDVVLGHGSHPDPAGALAPVLAEAMADGGPAVVAYLLGTEADPQGYSAQRRILEEIGCVVPDTNARAAHAAAAVVLRRPDSAEAEG